jgi:hypothetical protein
VTGSTEVAVASARQNARAFIEARVAERACRTSPEQVQDTCSFARAERLLGREYHGRFLIELLQNAADAWRASKPGDARSRALIMLDEGPALLVANRGAPFPESAVIESLGQIGRSTKAQGEAIGHKGIGFKSVLEMSLTPELYSGLQGATPTLAVRFDPRSALTLIRSKSPSWDEHVSAIDDIRDPLSAVPVLRYPRWVETLPAAVRGLAKDGFDTVIRLPFNADLQPESALDRDAWVAAVRDALTDITDEMLLLLATFDQLEIVDRLGGQDRVIKPRWEAETKVAAEVRRELVTVTRNGSPTSRWRLYRRTLPDAHDLSGEIAVGLRIALDRDCIVPALDGAPATPFHLFFPTKIGSGLPFLLHGYFEVNAARTGFYDGSAAHNQAILDELAELVARAVADTAGQSATAVASLPDLLGECQVPDVPHATAFHSRALGLLDDIAWVPLEAGSGVPELARPTDLLVDAQPEVIDRVAKAFPPSYILARTNRGVPSRQIGNHGHDFLVSRRPVEAPDLWESLASLCRPGKAGPWEAGAEDSGFRGLLDLFAALDVSDAAKTDALLDGLRGNSESCLLPVVAADGGRTLLPVPNVAEGVAGRRSRLVMARTRQVDGAVLIPPDAMDVAFLPDGLLDSEAQVDRAKPLGVRDFTVDNVLDRLRGIESSDVAPEPVLRFLWALLLREVRSEFSTQTAAQRAVEFDPSAWFWCHPGDGGSDSPEADRQRRRRLLAAIRLPARDGSWRPAATLAFGSDWAEWLESGARGPVTAALTARASAYRALDAVAPTEASMIASPEKVLSYMPDQAATGNSDEDELYERNAERHAFLLTLGVWEVIPVEAFESRETQNRERIPWAGGPHEVRMQRIAEAGGWRFAGHPWAGGEHRNVWIAEDFRFRWPLAEAAASDAERTAELLSVGTPLYSRLSHVAAFCPGCTSESSAHQRRYQSLPEEDYPSILAIELQTEPWIPAVLNGEMLETPQVASSVWWSERPPARAGLQQSPLRYLPLCDPEVGLAAGLRRLAGVSSLDEAGVTRLEDLLQALRHGFELGDLPVAPGSSSGARQAFIGLHRHAYERLSELALADEDAASVLRHVGVLCDLGDRLAYASPADARHDDGRFAAYRRYFTGAVPFATLPRERNQVATRLGVRPFVVSLQRRPSETSRDVTDELADLLGDRIAELLAIVVHHGLGTQTLELGSQQFEERATRLQNLRVQQVDDLVIDAQVEGSEATATIGAGSAHDLFLEGPTTSQPVLYHDLTGEDWKEVLRRKLAPHLAVLLENAAYMATLALFLLAESDADREEALHEFGITGDDVDAIRTAIGAASEEEGQRRRRWFSAIVATLRSVAELPSVELENLDEELVRAGLPADIARHVVERGGGRAVRADAGRDGVLMLLAENGVSLRQLDKHLREADGLDGLTIDVARRRLSEWTRQNRRRVAAVIAQHVPPDHAKALPDSWLAPERLRFELDPDPAAWLSPVTDSLQALGFAPNAAALADDPVAELIRMAGLPSAQALEARVTQLYDREEQERILRASAASWRRELFLLGTLARTQQGDSRAAIRARAATVDELLPIAPTSPAVLRPSLEQLFPARPSLASALAGRMTDALSVVPERASLLALANELGLASSHLVAVERALHEPRRDLARKLRARMERLETRQLRPRLPAGLQAAPTKRPPRPPGPRKVAAVKVTPKTDARKRQLGDEGERWALASVLSPIVALKPAERRVAIEEMLALLDSNFHGDPVERAKAHAEPACEPQLDEEELIDELTEFLHVAGHSDGFGFDLLGWLPPDPKSAPAALCLEVKSTSDGKFHLSRGEWERAESFKTEGEGERYAILVVHRGRGSDSPKRLDLLPNPVHLVETGQLAKRDDSYELAYQAS